MTTQIHAAMLKGLVICLWSTCSYNITAKAETYLALANTEHYAQSVKWELTVIKITMALQHHQTPGEKSCMYRVVWYVWTQFRKMESELLK